MNRALVLLPVGLSLAACGAGSASNTALPAAAATGRSVMLSADAASCVAASPAPRAGTASPSAAGPTCTIRVHYSNATAAPLTIDASLTRLTDSAGSTYRPEAAAGAVTSALVKPADQVSVDWIVNLAPGSTLKAVTWIGPTGDSSTVSLSSTAVSPTPIATATATPKPTPTPTPKPAATPKPKPTPTPTKSTSRPRPASSQPPASGSIG